VILRTVQLLSYAAFTEASWRQHAENGTHVVMVHINVVHRFAHDEQDSCSVPHGLNDFVWPHAMSLLTCTRTVPASNKRHDKIVPAHGANPLCLATHLEDMRRKEVP
jgi:hypothetical protein